MSRGFQGLQGAPGLSSTINNGFFGVYQPSTPLSVSANTITTIPVNFISLADGKSTFVASPNTFILMSGSIAIKRSSSSSPVKYRVILADTVTYPNPNSYEFVFDHYFGAEPNGTTTDNVAISAIIEPTSATSFTLAIEAFTSSSVSVASSVLGAFVLPVSQAATANANAIFSS